VKNQYEQFTDEVTAQFIGDKANAVAHTTPYFDVGTPMSGPRFEALAGRNQYGVPTTKNRST